MHLAYRKHSMKVAFYRSTVLASCKIKARSQFVMIRMYGQINEDLEYKHKNDKEGNFKLVQTRNMRRARQ